MICQNNLDIKNWIVKRPHSSPVFIGQDRHELPQCQPIWGNWLYWLPFICCLWAVKVCFTWTVSKDFGLLTDHSHSDLNISNSFTCKIHKEIPEYISHKQPPYNRKEDAPYGFQNVDKGKKPMKALEMYPPVTLHMKNWLKCWNKSEMDKTDHRWPRTEYA